MITIYANLPEKIRETFENCSDNPDLLSKKAREMEDLETSLPNGVSEPEGRQQFSEGQIEEYDDDIMEAVARSIADRSKIKILYITLYGNNLIERVLDPYEISVASTGNVLAVGRCDEWNRDWRAFALQNIITINRVNSTQNLESL